MQFKYFELKNWETQLNESRRVIYKLTESNILEAQIKPQRKPIKNHREHKNLKNITNKSRETTKY